MKDVHVFPHPVGTEKVAKPLVVGRKFVDNDDTSKYASVTVDELAIWDKQLSQEDIAMLMNA